METYTVSVHAVSHDGRGIARLPDKRIVFIPHALPGQRVDIAITKEHPQYAEGTKLRVTSEEGLREALCAEESRCGGCPLQRLEREQQLYWKERLVKDTLIKIAHISAETIRPIRAITQESGFRNKIEFAFGHESGEKGCVLGLKEGGSGRVHRAQGCILLPTEADGLREMLESHCRATGLAPYENGKGILRHLILRYGLGSQGKEWWIVCITSPTTKEERRKLWHAAEDILSHRADIAGFVHEERKKKDGLALGEKRIRTICRGMDQTATLSLPLGGRNFHLDATSFFQVNLAAADLLVEAACETLPDFDNLLDCFCGVGAPGLLLAEKRQSSKGSVLGFESHARSVRYAKGNAARLGIDARYTECRLEKAALPKDCDAEKTLVLLDPPRAGLMPQTTQFLLQAQPAHICYLSCNPATLARDLARLTPVYTVETVVPVDLFPHTAHVECCAWLHLKKINGSEKDHTDSWQSSKHTQGRHWCLCAHKHGIGFAYPMPHMVKCQGM